MDIIRFTIDNPVKIAVGVILVCLFGVLAVFQIPIQLTPNVDQPRVQVTTRWPGKNALEVEKEIVDRQEEKLKGVSNLRKMTSTSVEGQAQVTLEFFVGTDRDRALQEVDEKLNQVSGYPAQVERPEIVAADAALENPIAWILFESTDGKDVSTYRDFVWDDIKPVLERVEGLASVNVFGGREREVQVQVNPALLAGRGVTMEEFRLALLRENINVAAGTMQQGKREFVWRLEGEFSDTSQVLNTVIAYRGGGPVRVSHVADVVVTHEKARAMVRSKGNPVLAIPAYRETGANVIRVMNGLRKQIEKVNNEILLGRDLKLTLTQVYDETVYINSAIDLVRNNIFIGGGLALIVLVAFLRSGRATSVVAVSIPISVIGTFLAVTLLGRSMNVVMLSGMAFAVGMVVDNAVVVLENIYRHKQMGKSGFQAAYDGGSEVWGAILASTLTTMAVFIPVIFIEEEAGQLFRDIAIAISAGVGLSLLVAVLVIPTLSARVLGRAKAVAPATFASRKRSFALLVADFVGLINRSVILRLAVIVLFVAGSLIGARKLMPPSDYLPSGNRNLVIGFVITEPGLAVDEYRQLAMEVEDHLRPYWEAEPGSPEAAALPPVQLETVPGEFRQVEPALIDSFFIGTFQGMCFMGATSKDDARVSPLVPIMTSAVMQSSRAIGAIPAFFQTSLFGGIGGGNTVEIEIRGEDLDQVTQGAGQVLVQCMQRQLGFPRPDPLNFDLLRPEIQAVPDRVRAADVGMTVQDLGFILAAAVDGAYIGEFQLGGDKVDLKVIFTGHADAAVNSIAQVPVYTPSGHVVPLSSLVNFEEVGAPQQVNHIEEMPGIRLEVRPQQGVAIETAMEQIQAIIKDLRDGGQLSPGVFVSLAGNADKLTQTRAAMFGAWTGFNPGSILSLVQSRGFLALLVVYLLMSALFESFIHPIAILLTVPLAMVGGFAGLRIVHWWSSRDPVLPIQQLDVVTMLGFVILLGIVVNNAILIVHQTLNNLKQGMEPAGALHESVRTRVRPIFMTAFTSVGGMLPLALMKGPGSELYRGLASVMVGGLLVSTLFTIILVPVVYSMILSFRIWLMRHFGREDQLPPALAPATVPAGGTGKRDDKEATSPVSRDVPVPAGTKG